MIAKLSINVATAIWSVVVIAKPDALSGWPGFFAVSGILHENFVAGTFLVLSILAIVRLIFHSAPLMIGACVYGLFLLLWLYTWISLLVSIEAGTTAVRPGQLAAITVVTVLAFFAFVSNPKKYNDVYPAS